MYILSTIGSKLTFVTKMSNLFYKINVILKPAIMLRVYINMHKVNSGIKMKRTYYGILDLTFNHFSVYV